jgi:hypothetical protein
MTPPTCAVCRQPIRGSYYTNQWNLTFHGHHATCDACGHPTGEHGHNPLCVPCRSTVVSTPQAATTRARAVRHLLRARGIHIGDRRVAYGIARVPNPGHNSLGVTNSTVIRTASGVTTTDIEVVVKRDLPGLLFDAVVAHELTHVWFRVHGVEPAPIVNEGVAELTAYWMLTQAASPHAAAMASQIANNRDRLYGRGFRLAHGAERRHGWSAVAAALLATGQLPR